MKERGEKNGVEGLEIITGQRIWEMEPNLSKEVKAMLYAPTGGIVCPFKMTIALAENANVNGVEFAFDTCVENIEKTERDMVLPPITAGMKHAALSMRQVFMQMYLTTW